MSFLGSLFGGSTPKAMPMPTPPPPRIGDAAGQAAAVQERARARSKYGVDDTMLAGNTLGTSKSTGTTSQPRTLLG